MDWLELGEDQLTAIVLAVIAGALFLSFIVLWTRRSRGRAAGVASAEAVELHAAMVRLEGELPQLFRNMSGRLDAKMRALRELLREAGHAIDELRQLKGSTGAGPVPASFARSPQMRADAAESEAVGFDEAVDGPALDEAQRKPSDPAPQDPEDLRAQRYGHVYSLADTGLDAAQIAAETGMHRGEVELVLSLRRKRIRVDRGSRSEPARVKISTEEARV